MCGCLWTSDAGEGSGSYDAGHHADAVATVLAEFRAGETAATLRILQ